MANENIAKMFEKIVKPEEDKREYQGLVLENGLKALLISDKETDISAASLSVHVGSMSDPRDCLGIAHFLEHMLFMGTGKVMFAYLLYIRMTLISGTLDLVSFGE